MAFPGGKCLCKGNEKGTWKVCYGNALPEVTTLTITYITCKMELLRWLITYQQKWSVYLVSVPLVCSVPFFSLVCSLGFTLTTTVGISHLLCSFFTKNPYTNNIMKWIDHLVCLKKVPLLCRLSSPLLVKLCFLANCLYYYFVFVLKCIFCTIQTEM